MIFTFMNELTRFAGDAFHLYTIFLLITKIRTFRSCSGLSYKTQMLYLVIFIARYIDLFYFRVNTFLRAYNTIMKILYLSTQSFIIYLIRFKYYYTYTRDKDSFNILALIGPSLFLAFFLKMYTKTMFQYIIEYAWTFSILLEAVAVLPQLVLLESTGEAEVLTSRYTFCLGVYRFLYVIGWIFKKLSGAQVDTLLIACGIIQTILYVDFFVLYYKYIFSQRGKTTKIPY